MEKVGSIFVGTTMTVIFLTISVATTTTSPGKGAMILPNFFQTLTAVCFLLLFNKF